MPTIEVYQLKLHSEGARIHLVDIRILYIIIIHSTSTAIIIIFIQTKMLLQNKIRIIIVNYDSVKINYGVYDVI